MSQPISNPVVLVTGASRGIGRAIAKAFSEKGYAVAINFNKNVPLAEDVQNELASTGNPTLLAQGDVSDPAAVDALSKMIMAKWGRVDALVNNAGLSKDNLIVKASAEDFDKIYATNLRGPFNCMKTFMPLMKAGGGGSFLNVSSHLARRPVVGTAHYSATKAAVISLTQTAAMEFGRFGVRSNALIPGFHVTDLSRKAWEKKEELIRSWHLLKEMPSAAELGKFAVFIVESKTVTGQTFAFESRI